jgi:hypothetical protein
MKAFSDWYESLPISVRTALMFFLSGFVSALYDYTTQNGPGVNWQHALSFGLVGGVTGMLAYLKQSPLVPVTTVTTMAQTVTPTSVKTETTETKTPQTK